MRYAANPSLISRAHFARYLVEVGVARTSRRCSRTTWFPGKPGYVDHRWATLDQAVSWIIGAGVAVVAHPGRYKVSGEVMRQFLAEFQGLAAAIEVVCGSHTPTMCSNLHVWPGISAFAPRGDRISTGQGELRGPRAPPGLPEDLKPVWQLFA